ncbi:Na+/H+ antiporter family protein [Mangrovibacillus cuniculi]|uniref:TRAP transporter large permease subunit n=1 Tax=Mangrovibacillus cuniculi TaxID=2593652 RepID=A0A7S8CCN7_9BACI|nr:Na+/H+ antiporter NhaC family protein [Mangrovibacillus cuniculi]QPC47353.1 TRAP transporter large permease subunit [Mangrovibacillus cuniculi]
MNAVVIAVLAMLLLSLLRINVVFALIAGAAIGGLLGGLGVNETITTFTGGVGGGATVALSYALLGGFAVAISRTGLPNRLVELVLSVIQRNGENRSKALPKALIFFVILLISCLSQNVVPIHIAFIPLFIPPILQILNELKVDRRLIATIITFGLTAPYILLPVGFGQIFQQDILAANLESNGLEISTSDIPFALAIPVGGMFLGLLVAIFFSYRKPRNYANSNFQQDSVEEQSDYTSFGIFASILAIAATLVVQIISDSMIAAALTGITLLYITRAVKWSEADQLLTKGMQMMAFIGFVMIAAAGFAEVMKATGDVETLVTASADLIGNNQSLGALLMLIVGLLVTMGIGSSFSTIPIIATIFVPLCLELGFSPMATIALVGTAAALGDAGSPASDSTLGPTAGLNIDGQHNHIWDTCVPTFLHYNIPLIIFGWLAAIIL